MAGRQSGPDSMKPSVCLISPGHLSSTPRLVREAHALHRAGYAVQAVCGRHYPPADPLDQSLIDSVPWPVTRVAFSRSPLPKIQRAFARSWLATPLPALLGLLGSAHHAHIPSLAEAAAKISADLYIGHCPAGLAAAAGAARQTRALFGFDMEDFHPAETAFACNDPAENRALREMLTRLIPQCRHLTAASPAIADAFKAFGGIEPRVVLNVFSLTEALEESFAPVSDPGAPLRAYWFSQTIGPGRGLEGAVRALSRLGRPAELHLRGFPDGRFLDHLHEVARQETRPCVIVPLPPAPPESMVRLAAGADLGLSLEETQPLNRDLCLTNKIFAYLMAGLPQWLSPTRAQTALAPQLGRAAFLADPAHPDDSAATIRSFFQDPARVQEARREARRLAATRYCWEMEQKSFLDSVEAALDH
jgi:glycosyltransferase involved in cell wall biosynthesis